LIGLGEGESPGIVGIAGERGARVQVASTFNLKYG
jgi:hypothetical protein